MTLQEFIQKFDFLGSIILLEGKRNVTESDIPKLVQLGKILTENTSHILFRSGNAGGSDEYFSRGVVMADKSRLQVITPYTGHRKKENNAYETFSLDTINLTLEPEVIYHTKQNIRSSVMVDEYLSGIKNSLSVKAAYLIRDTVKVIGTRKIKPAVFAFFYDDLKKPKSGGTGHTMRVCERNKIPFIDQTVWFKWLE